MSDVKPVGLWKLIKASNKMMIESELTVIKKQEAIERVRDLHYEYPDTGDCAGCNHIYPCPTIKALDGE